MIEINRTKTFKDGSKIQWILSKGNDDQDDQIAFSLYSGYGYSPTIYLSSTVLRTLAIDLDWIIMAKESE